MSWDGKDRRKMFSDDHDLLIEIHGIVKLIPEWQKDHEKLDNKRFIWIGIAILVVATATGVMPQVLKIFNIGG